MFIENVITGLSVLTLVGDLFLIASWIIIFTGRKALKSHYTNISRHNLLFAFIVALIATSGSLFFSEIALFVPCELCWFQRIFMYPLSIILLIALLKKDQSVKKYVIPLALVGSIFSVYNYAIQILNVQTVCSADVADCSFSHIFDFGYISIPMMALTAFLMIIALLTIYGKKR